MKNIISYLLLFLFTIYSSQNFGQGANRESRPQMRIERINRSLEINGKMDNPVWGNAKPIELNYEVNPGDNSPAPEKTKGGQGPPSPSWPVHDGSHFL